MEISRPNQQSLFHYAAALQALKKRKLYESQLESVENNIMRVNEQQMMLENQRTTVETVSALSNAAKASKQTMHEMKVCLACLRLEMYVQELGECRQITPAFPGVSASIPLFVCRTVP
jgi:peroxiredoxin family protein